MFGDEHAQINVQSSTVRVRPDTLRRSARPISVKVEDETAWRCYLLVLSNSYGLQVVLVRKTFFVPVRRPKRNRHILQTTHICYTSVTIRYRQGATL
jgi:hypothetical protein